MWRAALVVLLAGRSAQSSASAVVTSFSGAGAVNASTDGGDPVVLTGSNFASTPFLGAVTYGPGGVGFTARNCTITVAGTQISCTTAPGTGRALQWVVTVSNQSSAPSAATTSYALPTLLSVPPASGPTADGIIVTLTGTNLGLRNWQAHSRCSSTPTAFAVGQLRLVLWPTRRGPAR